MSLMLRKACQPLLDNAGLDSYHVDIEQSRGYDRNLKIVGKCGQPFIRISGVTFNRKTPTQNEVEFATELLREFLAEHKKVIDEYIVRATAFKQRKEPDREGDDYSINNYGGGERNIRYLDSGLDVTLNKDGEVIEIAIRDNKLTPQNILDFYFDMAKHQSMVTLLTEYHAYQKEENEIDELKLNLSKCDI